MKKTVVLVGHCGADSSYLRLAVSSAYRAANIVMADDDQELSSVLQSNPDLVLFNRELGYGFDQTEGVAMIRQLRAQYPNVKSMLVSNYPEAQAAAVAAGGLPGFGKREIGTPKVAQVIREALGESVTQSQ